LAAREGLIADALAGFGCATRAGVLRWTERASFTAARLFCIPLELTDGPLPGVFCVDCREMPDFLVG
jgi:hypothetical protein